MNVHIKSQFGRLNRYLNPLLPFTILNWTYWGLTLKSKTNSKLRNFLFNVFFIFLDKNNSKNECIKNVCTG